MTTAAGQAKCTKQETLLCSSKLWRFGNCFCFLILCLSGYLMLQHICFLDVCSGSCGDTILWAKFSFKKSSFQLAFKLIVYLLARFCCVGCFCIDSCSRYDSACVRKWTDFERLTATRKYSRNTDAFDMLKYILLLKYTNQCKY